MPEGDTIHYLASRIRPVLEGHVPDEIATPHPRFGRDRWPERLSGRAVRAVDAYGKHLFVRFEGDLVIHSHLRMTGAWAVRPAGPAPPSAWLVMRRDSRDVIQLRGPVLELMTESRTRFDQRLAALGPDILAAELDEPEFLRRLRHEDPTRPIGDALLDQRTIAGLGTIWRTEGCFAARLDAPAAVHAQVRVDHEPALEAQEQVLAVGVHGPHGAAGEPLLPARPAEAGMRSADLVRHVAGQHGADAVRGVVDRVALWHRFRG